MMFFWILVAFVVMWPLFKLAFTIWIVLLCVSAFLTLVQFILKLIIPLLEQKRMAQETKVVIDTMPPLDFGELVDRGDGVYEPMKRIQSY